MNRRPTTADATGGPRSRLPLPPGSILGYLAAILTVVVIAIFSYRALDQSLVTSQRVTNTLETVQQLQDVLSLIKDAETGQRGYLLAGTEPYLNPYTRGKTELSGQIDRVKGTLAGNARQLQRLEVIAQLSEQKFDEMDQTIALRRAGDLEGALGVVRSDRGRLVMDRIRALVTEMQNEERATFQSRRADSDAAANFAIAFTWGSSALLLFLIAGAAVLSSRDHLHREAQIWLRNALIALGERLQGEQRLDVLGDAVLSFLCRYMDARVGAAYLAEPGGVFRRFATYALDGGSTAESVRLGDGLLGQAARDRRVTVVRDVPEGYLPISSSVGRGRPRQLLLAPAIDEGAVRAVIELGFLRRLAPADVELMERASEQLALAVRSARDRSRLEELLEETQRQAEELQAQQEELRVSNEELEEQSRALKESQAQLESQHAELEQTNSQLEEQTQLLENQKDALADAQSTLVSRADELERASQYKSEFLANMSHELRTPLNSSLILAKLLADNKDGNLSDEQVRFAQTISSAGNDLLALINDILDLSKIEAGKIDLDIEPVDLRAALESMVRGLQPVARQKALGFTLEISPVAPERVDTDSQRLGQIVKNLLSNALKFTEKGSVAIKVDASGDGGVSIAVHDTGIGIEPHQQAVVFEAFRQGDGSTHRKYGGTGLGLAISRDLARRLGGDVTLVSEAGRGSVFTLTLPARAPAQGEAPGPATRTPAPTMRDEPAAVAARERVVSAPVIAAGPRHLDDDRDVLDPQSRLILVVEDDVRFASILRDLVHELGYQCIVTHSANEGLAAATAFLPSAVLLDMNLPDHSGLGVLDQLKRNPKTRHIPVHVASVSDYSKEALELGAVGYALKPVKREELVDALHRLEAKFSQGLRRVLVVEDDDRQRESIERLLGSGDVQITGVASAGQALSELQSTTFDCMVMDLNLPDLSGYELLEQMSSQHDVSFPPVIVYTGRSLTRNEEQELRRFSKSIIIKDARSPERLLDEVTLFLHQVESRLPPESQRLLKVARDRDSTLEGRRVLVVEDDVRNVFALTSVLEPKGVKVDIARNGLEAIEALTRAGQPGGNAVDLVLMDIMMPEMDGFTAMREIRKRSEWRKLPIIALTAKAMKDDQEKCMAAGANDYIAKPLDVEKLLSLVRVWMPK